MLRPFHLMGNSGGSPVQKVRFIDLPIQNGLARFRPCMRGETFARHPASHPKGSNLRIKATSGRIWCLIL